MKFFIEEEMYFEGRICSYDGQTGKYGAFFPSDGTTFYPTPATDQACPGEYITPGDLGNMLSRFSR